MALTREPIDPAGLKVPEMPLPDGLEDLIGDLLQEADEFDDDADDVSSAWGDNLNQAGWGVTDGPMSMFSAKGKTGNDPDLHRLYGTEGDFGKLLGVDNEWLYRIVKDVGNYGDLYDATFGAKGLGLPRGMNSLYDKGGLMTMPTWH